MHNKLSLEISIETVYRQREVGNKCLKVFPIYSKSHRGISVTLRTRTIVPITKYRIEQTDIHLIVTRPYETAETESTQLTDVH